MPFCPECGSEVEAGEKFCYSCGKTLRSVDRPRAGSQTKPEIGNEPQAANSPKASVRDKADLDEQNEASEVSSESSIETESFAISRLKAFAILEVVGLFLVFVAPLLFGVGASLSFLTSLYSMGNGLNTSGNSVILIPTVIILGLIVGIVASSQLRTSFKAFSAVDRGFSASATLSLVLIAGMFLVFVGVIAFVFIVWQWSAAISNPLSAPSDSLVSVVGLEFVFGTICAILGTSLIVIGGIGTVVGLWRFGDKYDEGIMKVSAILHLIPIVWIAGGILVFVGAQSARFDLKE